VLFHGETLVELELVGGWGKGGKEVFIDFQRKGWGGKCDDAKKVFNIDGKFFGWGQQKKGGINSNEEDPSLLKTNGEGLRKEGGHAKVG